MTAVVGVMWKVRLMGWRFGVILPSLTDMPRPPLVGANGATPTSAPSLVFKGGVGVCYSDV